MRLQGNTAVITGAANGIGEATAHRFADEGAQVMLIDLEEAKLDAVVDEIRAQHGSKAAYGVCADVRRAEEVGEAFAALDQVFARLDICMANAGIDISRAFLDMPLDEWQRVLDINLTGVFLVTQQAARRMMRAGGGSIIAMSSTNGLSGERDQAAYNASKAGVLLLTKTIAIELAPHHIRANAICPGFIDTGLAEKSGDSRESVVAYVDKVPLGRLGRPADVADAALFLASAESQFITGTSLVVDGGQLAEE